MDSAEVTEIKRHFGIVAERLESRIQQLAEGVAHLDEKLESEITTLGAEMHQEFDETRAMIRLSYAELDRRLRVLETGYSSLESRVQRLEAR